MIWTKKLYILSIYIFARTAPHFWQRFQNRVVSYIYFLLWRSKRQPIMKNLSVITGKPESDPEIARLTRKMFENYGWYLRDYVLINSVTKRNFRKMVAEEHGTHYIKQALKDGKGAILITPHLGNWELGGITLALRECHIYALTLKDAQEEVQQFRDAMRGTLGVDTIHINPDDQTTIIKIARLLRQNKVVAMLGDRWEGGKKQQVTFFGRRVCFPSGAMALAQATGCAVIPVFVVLRPDGRYRAWMEKPIKVERRAGQPPNELIAEKTQELALVFEKVIRAYPDQWYQFFDFWSRYSCEKDSAA